MKDLVAEMQLLALNVMRDDRGVTAIEYALLAALIAIACVVAFQATGDALVQIYVIWSGAVIEALTR